MSAFTLSQVATLLSSSFSPSGPVRVGGWLTHARFSKKVAFLVLSDGSSHQPLQVVVPGHLLEDQPHLRDLGPGCSVRVEGDLVPSRGAGQAVELLAHSVEIMGLVDDPRTYPIQPKPLAADFLRSLPHLRHRVAGQAAIARLRHVMSQAIHDYFATLGFMWVATPILTAADAEGAGSRFQVVSEGDTQKDSFFGKPTFLTVSGQLAGEALCMGLSRVYTFGPTFRAERSHTSRHLAEFWMVEPEVAFADLQDIISLSEGLLKHVVSECLTKLPMEMEYFAQEGGRTLEQWHSFVQQDFACMTYTDAIEKLQLAPHGTFSILVSWGDDLLAEHERWLVEQVGKPLAITHYPAEIKSFYMKATGDGRTVEAMDILVPGMGELIGGSTREDDLQRLEQRMIMAGMDPAEYQSYMDLRRYGSVPHAGFGLGFERLVAYISGTTSVRDVIAYPRASGLISD